MIKVCVHGGHCGLQTMLRASTAVIVDCDSLSLQCIVMFVMRRFNLLELDRPYDIVHCFIEYSNSRLL